MPLRELGKLMVDVGNTLNENNVPVFGMSGDAVSVELDTGTKINAATLEAGGVGMVGWLSSVRFKQDDLQTAIEAVTAAVEAGTFDTTDLEAAIAATTTAVEALQTLLDEVAQEIVDTLETSTTATLRDSLGVEIGEDNPLDIRQAALHQGTDDIAGVLKKQVGLTVTASGETQILAAPTSGNFYRIFDVMYSLRTDAPVDVSLRYGASNTDNSMIYLGAQGALARLRIGFEDLPVDDNIYVNLSGASSVRVHVWYAQIDPNGDAV